jgi:hypothetical protein
MHPILPSFQQITIRATLEELREGTFQMPPDEIRLPIVQLTFFVEVGKRTTETRTRVSAEFMDVVPDWKKYTGRNILSSIDGLPSPH